MMETFQSLIESVTDLGIIPARYAGELGTCGQRLHECSHVFEQRPQSYSGDQSKIAVMSFCMGLSMIIQFVGDRQVTGC